ncbi:hypothetical protein ABZX51_012017 [Aspergillus tubingensis]
MHPSIYYHLDVFPCPQILRVRPAEFAKHQLPQDEEQAHRLVRAVKEVILFSASEKEQYTQPLDAFVEKVVSSKGTNIFSQGGIGDNLYIVKKDTFDYYFAPALTQQTTTPSIGTKHGTAHPGGVFGELALL